jgi:glycosyltransferase involved in cell wall biosynthesis
MALQEQITKKNRGRERRILYVVSEDWYFASHRLDLAVSAIAHGWTVAVACRGSNSVATITSAGVVFREWHIPRGSLNPVKFVGAISSLRKHVRDFQPSSVHAVSIVTVVIARLALLGLRHTVLISTVAGLGRLSRGGKLWAALKNKALAALGSWLTNPEGYRLIAQNRDDYLLLGGFQNERLRLISGSGVNPERFPKTPITQNTRLSVLLVARMIHDKGIVEFVRAMGILNSEGVDAVGYLVGKPDPGNPRSLSEEELENLTKGSSVSWLGHREDIYELMADSDVVCLPTYYGEGIPRVLLEAGCVGRTVVSCDVPGPRDLVRDEVDGLLVAPRDATSLAQALRMLSADRALIQEMGDALHDRVIANYSNQVVLKQYINLYKGD